MPRGQRTQDREETGRRRRRGLGSHQLGLTVGEEALDRENYAYRWINDNGEGRLQQAQGADWEFVEAEGVKVGANGDGNSDVGNAVSRIVGRNKDGSPQRAYLMRLKKEFYNEDQAEKQAELDEVDEAIRRGSIGSEKPGAESRYVKQADVQRR